MLNETQNDYGRLAFANNTTLNQWHIAGLPNPSAPSALFNIWYAPTGDVVRVAGDGQFWLRTLPAFSSANPLCGSTASGASFIGHCSSSQRYKKDVETFEPGLALVERLRAVSFTSLSSGQRDLGFIAEEVSQVHPILATYDAQGRPEGVRYMELTAVLSNAIKEQQRTIEEQRSALDTQSQKLDRQQRQIDELEAIVKRQQLSVEANATAMRALSQAVASLRPTVTPLK